jgi:HAD superfamily hydrolase (TIGR01509 family)
LGITITREKYEAEFLGCNDRECLENALAQDRRRRITQLELEEIVERKSRYYFDLIGNDPPFVAGAIDFIRQASTRYQFAIVSGALRKEIIHNLTVANLLSFFAVIISADDVTSSKPDPEGFNLAVARLDTNLVPGQCIVIEDSARGVQAAKRAGMRCLALTTTLERSLLTEADWILDSFPQPADVPWMHK